jgi:hypothetical protein
VEGGCLSAATQHMCHTPALTTVWLTLEKMHAAAWHIAHAQQLIVTNGPCLSCSGGISGVCVVACWLEGCMLASRSKFRCSNLTVTHCVNGLLDHMNYA